MGPRFRSAHAAANELVAEIHGRMPAILPADIYDLAWAGADLRDPLNPFPAEPMTMWPVSTRVNTPRNDDEGLIRPIRRDGARAVGRLWHAPSKHGHG